MPEKRIEAYDSTTGKKLPVAVPESWLTRFKTLRKTPRQQSADTTKSAPSPQKKES